MELQCQKRESKNVKLDSFLFFRNLKACDGYLQSFLTKSFHES